MGWMMWASGSRHPAANARLSSCGHGGYSWYAQCTTLQSSRLITSGSEDELAAAVRGVFRAG